jgi:hypothetical protein
MIHIGRTNSNKIGVKLVKHLLGICIPIGHVMARGGFSGGYLTDIGNANYLYQALFSKNIKRGKVSTVCYHSRAYNCNSQFVHNIILLI